MNLNSSSTEVKVCRRCLYDENHPLGITFDEEGVCSGCQDSRRETDAKLERSSRFPEVLDSSLSFTRQKSYDCIVPVSGGRDSYFIVHTVTKVLGMKPLLVSYNKHYNTPEGIHNLNHLKTVFDCDHIQMNVNPRSVKAITKAHLGTARQRLLALHSRRNGLPGPDCGSIQGSADHLGSASRGSIRPACTLTSTKSRCHANTERTTT